MKTNSSQSLAAVTALTCSFTTLPAMAIDVASVDLDAPEQGGGGFVGLGVAYVPDYEGSDQYEAIPAPFGTYQWASGRYVELTGTEGSEHAGRLSANIISHDWSSALEFGTFGAVPHGTR